MIYFFSPYTACTLEIEFKMTRKLTLTVFRFNFIYYASFYALQIIQIIPVKSIEPIRCMKPIKPHKPTYYIYLSIDPINNIKRSHLMWSACHKKRYLLCVELTNFGIFTKPFPIFFQNKQN